MYHPVKMAQVSPAYSSKMSDYSEDGSSSLGGSMVLDDVVVPVSKMEKKSSGIKSLYSDSEPREK